MRTSAVISALALGLLLRAQTPTPNPQLLFFDDFSAGQLDRSKWNVIITGRTVNNEQQAYVDSTDTITVGDAPEASGAEHGALIIRGRHRPGFKTPHSPLQRSGSLFFAISYLLRRICGNRCTSHRTPGSR